MLQLSLVKKYALWTAFKQLDCIGLVAQELFLTELIVFSPMADDPSFPQLFMAMKMMELGTSKSL